MKKLLLSFSLFLMISSTQTAFAGSTIKRACMRADRPNATRALCSCIQNVADDMLSRSEQSKAAKFFKDPDKSQSTRQSDNRSKERFWKKYKSFGQAAYRRCRG